MTPKHLGNIHTTGSSTRGTLPCPTWDYKYPSIFTYWPLLPSTVSLLWGGTVEPKIPIPVSSRRPVTFEKAKKEWTSRLIIATTSIQPPKLVSTDLTLKSDSILTNPIGKSFGARLIDAIKDLSLKVFLLWHHH